MSIQVGSSHAVLIKYRQILAAPPSDENYTLGCGLHFACLFKHLYCFSPQPSAHCRPGVARQAHRLPRPFILAYAFLQGISARRRSKITSSTIILSPFTSYICVGTVPVIDITQRFLRSGAMPCSDPVSCQSCFFGS